MNCTEIEQRLSEFLYRLLNREQAEAIQAHLRGCAHCSAKLKPLQTRTCREITDFLYDYSTGALSPEERASFEAHLKVCPPCIAYMQSYQTTVKLAKGAYQPPTELPEDLPDQLLWAILASRPKS
ncbi:MAG TPA: zf-HC2 domain-containing protein [Acidobacteriota bacterium]|jgi:anti-sigma factor RsiW